MNIKCIIFLLINCLIFFSCKDSDDITVNLQNGGTISTKIVDNNGQPIENVKVSINFHYEFNLLEGYSNNKGIYNSEKLMQGSYFCFASLEKDGLVYTNNKEVTVLNNEVQNIEINVFEYIGNLTIRVNTAQVVNVALFQNDQFWYDIPVAQKIGKASINKTIDSSGALSLTDLPTGRYTIIVYDAKTTEILADKSVYVEKGETIDWTY